MSKDSTTRLSKLPTSASGAIPKTYAQYLSSKEQTSKAEERPGLTKSAFVYVDSSKNPQQPERVRYVYTNDPSALAGQSDFQFVYAENTEVPKVSSSNLFSEKVVKPGPPATSSSNFPSTSPAHSSAETIKDRTLDAKAKFLATPGASVVEAKYSVTSPLETTRAFPSTSSGPYRPDRTSYLPNYTQRIDRLPYYTTSSGLRPVETKAPTAAVDYVNAEAFDSPSSSSSSYTATVHLVGKTPGVPTALPQAPVVSSALSRSPPAPIIHPRTPGTSVTPKTASVPTPAVTPLSPVTPAETAPMSTLGAQAREERLATVSTVGEQLAQLSSANVAQTEVASSVIENKTVSQGSKKKSSSRERTQTPDDDRPGSPEFRSGVTRSGSNTPCGTLRVYRVVELADGVQHTPIQVLGSKGHRQSLGRKSHEYAVDDDEGHGHMPDVLASKEYQKGFESPRVSEKTSLYASSSFRSETNGGSGDYTSKYKDVGACANTLSKLDGPVGFSTLPEQVYNKTVKRGFEFTLMVCGESGLGKSTLVNSLFCADIYSADYPGPSQRTVQKTVQVETTKVVLQEGQVTLTLTIVDTPGFGGNLDNTNCWMPLIDFIEDKYAEYLQEETKIQRSAHIVDNRVHCCLYFIAPSGHGLKSLDVEVMKKLHDKVNIVPVIAKADTFTPEECQLFKRRIQNELTQHGIKVYDFPSLNEISENGSMEVGGSDGTDLKNGTVSKSIKDRLPFAIVGSNALIEIGGKKVRARKYPWGTVEVDSIEHCDFIPLRNVLIRSHMQDLKEVTHNCHYEHFRVRKLTGGACAPPEGGASNKNPLAQMEEEKKEHDAKVAKMRQEMETVFAMKVKEKLQKLEENETERSRRHEEQMKSLEQQRAELEERERNFERERFAFEATHQEYADMFRKMTIDNRDTLDSRKQEKRKEKKKGLF
ncbi:endochitinase A-like isoform X3 [Varroa destructor]|uniref:Septin-type G domain-containing protein n=1 Tax=Varroa destructor TaxID=109461 RepID=A0A7M7K6Y1_VARDE|nr:endochitinase A-like isoform X3 [Varroa destructor]